MLPVLSVIRQRLHRFHLKGRPRIVPLGKLPDSLAHDPISRPLTFLGKRLHDCVCFIIESDSVGHGTAPFEFSQRER